MGKSPEIHDFIEILRSTLGNGKDAKDLHSPEFDETEKKWLADCIDSGWVSTAGPFVPRFEKSIADFTGIPYVVATSNGTAALHACLLLAGVTAGEEVLVPSFTFVATANVVKYCGALPHFVEIERETLGVSPRLLEKYLGANFESKSGGLFNKATGRRVRALMAMHTFGHPAALRELAQVCEKFGLILIEDAAEALGSFYHGEHVGGIGRIAALSFNGNKVVTTGGGGAVLTRDKDLGARAKHLTTTAKVPHTWAFDHDEVGYNYRLPNLNAALGCAQMEKLERFLSEKRVLAERYLQAFADTPFEAVREPENCRSNYWLNAVLLPKADLELRNQLIESGIAAGLGMRPAWTLMHRLPMFRNCPRMDLSFSEELEARLINLPSSPRLARQK